MKHVAVWENQLDVTLAYFWQKKTKRKLETKRKKSDFILQFFKTAWVFHHVAEKSMFLFTFWTTFLQQSDSLQ